MFKPINFFALAVLIASLASTALAQQALDRETDRPTLTVAGRGEVQVAPDRAIISFGAVAESEEAAEAQKEVNEILTATIDELRGLDIPERQIQTSSLNLHPVHRYDQPQPRGAHGPQGPPKIVGYRASYTLTVIVDQIDTVGNVIDKVLATGVNQFQGIQFALQDDSKARQDALKKAAESAKQKAAAIASAMGVTLGQPRRITEGGSDYGPPRPMMARMAMMEDAAMSTPVQAGELNIQATLVVEYDITE